MLKLSPKGKKRLKERKALKKYYNAYYNDNYLRNYRFIYDKEQSFIKDGKEITYNAKSLTAFKYGKHDNSSNKAPNWLIVNSRSNEGTLAGEITYYKTLEDFKEGKLNKRFCDRLFIDLDVNDSPEVDKIKDEFKLAHARLEGKEHDEIIEILQDDFKALIFENDLLLDVFHEAKSLSSYLTKYGLKPYLIFSGAKGFHINIFYPEMQLTNLSQISQTLAMSYSKDLSLKYIDTNVFDKNKAHKRLQRCQYGLHGKTNLMTTPLPLDVTYEDLLTIIEKNKRHPIDFDFNEMLAPEGFNKMLLKLDHEITFKNAQRQKELESINKAKKMAMQKKYGKGYKSFQDIDLREIANDYGIDGEHQDDKIIVSCPFHHDLHPSGVVFKSRFYCSTCNMTLNYYEFISKLEGTTDKDKIIQKAMEFLK